MVKKYVYLFEEGRGESKALLGGKGAGLAEMTGIGLPVPPGLTITTEACNEFYRRGKTFPEGMEDQLWESMAALEEKIGKKTGQLHQSSFSIGSFRCAHIHARDDGYYPEPRSE